MGLICEAIRTRSVLAFDYGGLPRIVAPYCHGFSQTGREVVRAVQLGGASSSGKLGFGKLWIVAKLARLRLAGELFVPDDPDYNPDDRHIPRIHCRI